jgi:sugar phosphate permease
MDAPARAGPADANSTAREPARNTSGALTATTLLVLGAITLAQATEAFTVQGFPTLIPSLTRELLLTKTEIGMLTSSFFAGGFLTVLPAGWLIDRIGVRLSMSAGLALMAVCVAIAAGSDSFPVLYACLFLSGIGFGSVYPATTKAVMHWAPAHWRGMMMGIKQTGVPLGGVLASLTLPLLLTRATWRGALLVAAALCGACVFVCYWMYRTHPDEETPGTRRRRQLAAAAGGSAAGRPLGGHTPSQPAFRGTGALRAALASPNIWLINLADLFLLGTQSTLVGWLVAYLNGGAGWSVVAAGGALAAVQAGGAVGRLGWGTVSDMCFGGRRLPIIVCLGLTTATVLSLLPYATASGYGAVLAASFVGGLSGLGWVGMVTVLRAELAPPGAVGIVTSLGSFTGYIGSLLGPPLFGLTLDRTGNYELAWRLFAVASLVAALLASRAREREGGRPTA